MTVGDLKVAEQADTSCSLKFGIVVPNFNYGDYLEQCLESLDNQIGVNITVIIVDGGSTDNSRKVAEKYAKSPRFTFFEQKGLGLVASLKFGFEHLGDEIDILGWLNSDDVLLRNDSLLQVGALFDSFFSADVISCGGYYIDQEAIPLRPVKYDYHPLIRGNVILRGGGYLQPSTFWKVSVGDTVSLRDDLKYTFDGYFFLECIKQGYSFIHLPNVFLSGYRIHGSNLSLNVPARRVRELGVLYEELLDRPWAAVYLRWLSSLLQIVEKVPFVGGGAKTMLRLINNVCSYLTRYIIPSV